MDKEVVMSGMLGSDRNTSRNLVPSRDSTFYGNEQDFTHRKSAYYNEDFEDEDDNQMLNESIRGRKMIIDIQFLENRNACLFRSWLIINMTIQMACLATLLYSMFLSTLYYLCDHNKVTPLVVWIANE